MNANQIITIALGINTLFLVLQNLYNLFRQPKKLINRYIVEEREAIMEEVKAEASKLIGEVLEKIEKEIGEIKTIVRDQDAVLEEKLNVDRKALRIILHREIERIYEDGLSTKTLTPKERRHLHTLYERYDAVEGNGYITNIVEQMLDWKTEEDKK